MGDGARAYYEDLSEEQQQKKQEPITETNINDIIVIQHSPKFDIEELKNNPSKIIIDGSNYPSYSQDLKKELGEKVWITSEQGAYQEKF
jgi:hypothetical protein